MYVAPLLRCTKKCRTRCEAVGLKTSLPPIQGTAHPLTMHRPITTTVLYITHNTGIPPSSNQCPRFPNFPTACTNKRNQLKAKKSATIATLHSAQVYGSRPIHQRPKLVPEIKIDPMSMSMKVSGARPSVYFILYVGPCCPAPPLRSAPTPEQAETRWKSVFH